ncbi:MAG: hypothetical protein FWF36_09375, partial [Propionibacteriaceae bacterium]|nr:hypothetical protein [Propionibacteriaceae bacterium]
MKAEPRRRCKKHTRGQRRTDLEPLTKRFPLLGSPVAAIWYSGQMGDDSIPGPTTYWIDAVVTL